MPLSTKLVFLMIAVYGFGRIVADLLHQFAGSI